MPKLLLLACSGKKDPNPVLLPAHARYQGPLWATLRQHRPQGAAALQVLVISARYGVISEHEPIPDYNVAMTDRRADELMRQALPKDPWDMLTIEHHLRPSGAWDMPPLIVGSQLYRAVAVEALAFMSRHGTLPLSGGAQPMAQRLDGGIGTQRWLLKQWLLGKEITADFLKPVR